jgi:hypothetical protein
MPQIAKAVHEEVITRDMVPAFVKLLKDTEAEVRTAIAGQIPGMLCQIRFCGTFTNLMIRLLHLDRPRHPA